jgi:putative Ca2+/H+ antiporter (TMEM165/GDT1 family)
MVVPDVPVAVVFVVVGVVVALVVRDSVAVVVGDVVGVGTSTQVPSLQVQSWPAPLPQPF